MKKGSITIFSAMSMMLVASLLFALLESARYYGLRMQARQKSVLCTESVFAEYQPQIWESYHLLLLDGAYGGKEFSVNKAEGVSYQLLCKNLNYDLIYDFRTCTNVFQMDAEEVCMESYQLVADDGGAVFFECVADYTKQNLSEEAAREIYQQIKAGEKQKRLCSAKKKQSAVKTESDTNFRSKTYKTVKNESNSSEGEETLLDIVAKQKQNAILGMVISDTDDLSGERISLEETLLKRNCQKGNWQKQEKHGWYEKVLFGTYAADYFSNYTKQMENRALNYEMEYLICGKESDKANLEGVAGRLLLEREACNAVAIRKDPLKEGEAEKLALLLAGYTENPAIIETVKLAIVGAWAYAESVLDVRTLLQGGKIALVKTTGEWTLRLEDVAKAFQQETKAKECKAGLTYEQYLQQFLLLQSERELSYRMMDIIEQNLHKKAEYKDIRMDFMVVKAKLSYRYGAKPLFWNLVFTEGTKKFSYSFCDAREFSYQIE